MGLISRCSWDSRNGQEETKERKNWEMKGFPYGKRILISVSPISFNQQAQCKFMLSSFNEAYVCVWRTGDTGCVDPRVIHCHIKHLLNIVPWAKRLSPGQAYVTTLLVTLWLMSVMLVRPKLSPLRSPSVQGLSCSNNSGGRLVFVLHFHFSTILSNESYIIPF